MSASASDKGQILGRIRDVLGDRPPAAYEYASIDRAYCHTAALAPAARVELLADRLRHYQVGVERCEHAALPRTIGEALARRSRRRILVPPGVPREWLSEGFEPIADEGLSHADLDRVDGVLTGCSLAIAHTGTLVLLHAPIEGRRALTLVPDYHLCVVFADQIVETVPEAIRAIAARRPALVTTISGPSATSDIEMTRIRGVHGPRTLDVVLVA